MGRRREDSILDSLFATLKFAPNWLGPVLAIIVFAGFRWLLPWVLSTEKGQLDVFALVRNVCPVVSWYAGGMVLIIWVVAEFHKFSNKRLVDRHSTNTAGMTWREFERLVCEAYRRRGYVAEVVGSESGDGGIDVRLNRGSELALVQCKHWRSTQVGVAVVRELLGVVASEAATTGIVVTSGVFTKDAEEFAARNPQIALIDGEALARLIQTIRRGQIIEALQERVQDRPVRSAAPTCPDCGSAMVRRTARKGAHAGKDFWGCPRFPGCRRIVNV
jgi:restriction system protein